LGGPPPPPGIYPNFVKILIAPSPKAREIREKKFDITRIKLFYNFISHQLTSHINFFLLYLITWDRSAYASASKVHHILHDKCVMWPSSWEILGKKLTRIRWCVCFVWKDEIVDSIPLNEEKDTKQNEWAVNNNIKVICSANAVSVFKVFEHRARTTPREVLACRLR